MTEQEIRSRWENERPVFEAWADFVQASILRDLESALSPTKLGDFLKLPVVPRAKETKSVVDKALYRNKGYADPYGDITDKVGMRFVVLLSSEIRVVEKVILGRPNDWEAAKDRDFEDERRARPLEFAYQSVHYILRAARPIMHRGLQVPAGTPCEIQVRTLLQHAHSELTHDTIYKPKKTASPEIKRTVAKSMALIEAADDFFELVIRDLAEASESERAAMRALGQIYTKSVGVAPEAEKSNLLILDAFSERLGADLEARMLKFLDRKGYVPGRIAERAKTQHLFRQPAILLAYLFASEMPAETKRLWPLTEGELKPVFQDLGVSFDGI